VGSNHLCDSCQSVSLKVPFCNFRNLISPLRESMVDVLFVDVSKEREREMQLKVRRFGHAKGLVRCLCEQLQIS